MKRSAYFLLVLLFAACGGQQTSDDHSNGSNHNGHTTSNSTNPNTNSHSVHTAADHSAMTSSPGAASAPYELQFIDTMIAHHQGAIEMARLAEQRAENSDLKKLARNMVDEQERENARLTSWREAHFAEDRKAINMDLPGMREGMGRMDMKKLEVLKGREFDIEFVKQMIPHHEGAVRMAEDAVAKVGNPSSDASNASQVDPAKLAALAKDLRAFALNVGRTQSAEVVQMKLWLAEWSKK